MIRQNNFVYEYKRRHYKRKSEGRFGAQRKRRGWENKCSGELIPCPFRTWEKVVLVDLDIGMGNVHLPLD